MCSKNCHGHSKGNHKNFFFKNNETNENNYLQNVKNHDFELDDLNNNLTAEQIEQLTNLGIDISPRKDKGLLKVVMKEGRGKNRPLIEDKVHIRYHMWYKNGEKIKHFGNKYSFLFGKGV